ncbi:MAG: class I SAM-dependent methyltransferase [Planctomycetes bacterium]|nr:class I SAM-dependent methyltransferase [Planctomycetota bacterium]
MEDEMIEELRNFNSYVWLPTRVETQLQIKTEDFKQDRFGARSRLNLIRNTLSGLKVGKVVDLAGHSGYFSLELLDAGTVSESVVYDINDEVLRFGERLAMRMDLQDAIKFVKKDLRLDNIADLPDADLALCLNLIHHAGTLFDRDAVATLGWGKYATQYLSVLRTKYRYAIVGVGFKSRHPASWPVFKPLRPLYFCDIIAKSGWRLIYDANIYDLATFGEEEASGLRTRRSARIRLAQLMSAIVGHRASNAVYDRFRKPHASKLNKYHIFILS